ncbi:MAG: M28 family peptidase [Verrucomicrobiota bacterium]|nr:M28 family peptidase [Verrucomicrobiota bacterium]
MTIETHTKESALETLLNDIPRQIDSLRSVRETFLTDAVLLGEIPSPTFGEADRIRLVIDRFRENGLEEPTLDEFGNASGIIPGSSGESAILVSAHVDSVFSSDVRHVLEVGSDHITGPGIADNSIGLAAVVALPKLLDFLNIRFKDDLILLANVKSLGRANLEGARGFLDTLRHPVRAGICVEGATQGRLSYSGLGALRVEITLNIPKDYDWTGFGAAGAISHINRLINQLMEIPLPKEPKTKMTFGGLTAGSSFNTSPKTGRLRFEITSEGDEVIDDMENRLNEICEQFSLETGTEVKMETVAKRQNCGIPFSHPLVKVTRSIMDKVDITPKVDPSTGDLNALIRAGHPGVTLGLTTVENLREENETIQLEPLYTGLSQFITLLQAIDGGLCEE